VAALLAAHWAMGLDRWRLGRVVDFFSIWCDPVSRLFTWPMWPSTWRC